VVVITSTSGLSGKRAATLHAPATCLFTSRIRCPGAVNRPFDDGLLASPQ